MLAEANSGNSASTLDLQLVVQTILGALALILTYYKLKAEIVATTVTTAEVKWIHDFRAAVADFAASVTTLGLRYAQVTSQVDAIEDIEKAYHAQALVRLMLTASNSNHTEVLDLLDDYASVIADCREIETGILRLAELHQDVVAAADSLIEAEWQRIKEAKR